MASSKLFLSSFSGLEMGLLLFDDCGVIICLGLKLALNKSTYNKLFNMDGSVRTRISSRRNTHARTYATRLRSVYLPEDARRTHVRRSRHLLFMTRRSRVVELPGSRGTGYT
ncbi:hypothetical protein CRG98_014141 [Punica granatum]|uniref:Uncharacterized protein n=1 Tax=Punica granatum TaxID=22663 RepID=A0A2I0KBF4_PUNGR|nr:hypothetical protein CRG98_014141 [Punica granatum]